MSNDFFKAAIARNHHVMADPFYAAHLRTGMTAQQISQLSLEQMVVAVFGADVAARLFVDGNLQSWTPAQSTYFALWLAMQLRQKPLVEGDPIVKSPVGARQRFVIASTDPERTPQLMGLDLLRSIGQQVAPPTGVMSAAWGRYRAYLGQTKPAISKQVATFSEMYELKGSAIKQAVMGLAMAECLEDADQDIAVLVFGSAKEFLTKEYGNLPANLVFVDHNWIRVMDFNATADDVCRVIDVIAKVVNTKRNTVIEARRRDDGVAIVLDGSVHFVVTPKDGVFEESRTRRFNNMLITPTPVCTGYLDTKRIEERDLVLVNSYGTFLYGLLYKSAPFLLMGKVEAGQFAKTLLKGEELPMTSDDEVGPGDGDRLSYERYVTQLRSYSGAVPFRFSTSIMLDGNVEPHSTVLYTNEVSLFRTNDLMPARARVNRAALLAFNLVPMPRGQYIDGRRSCVQVRHIPAAQRAQFLINFCQIVHPGKDAAEALRAQFKLSTTWTAEQVLDYVGQHLIVGLSSKLAKLIKRTVMADALVGRMADGKGRGLKRYGQVEESQNNWHVEAIVSPTAIWPAGMACYWGDAPELLVDHTQQTTPPIPVDQAANVVELVKPEFGGSEITLEYDWYTIRFNNIPVDTNTIVATIPYSINGVAYDHFITNTTPGAELTAIQWRLAKVRGNQQGVQVRVLTVTKENSIKARNNVKAMFTRYDSRCVHNELNAALDLQARAVFFKDTNKWLDAVQSCCDVAALTAINNKDLNPEGYELVLEANMAAGSGEANCLVWSPVLALQGVYEPLLNWFKQTYGTAVWFRWPDPTGDWVRILKGMYTNEETAQPIKGWQAVSGDQIPGVIPQCAKNVVALADGDVASIETNIIVFYELGGCPYFIQRAFSYAGNSTTGPVWQPVKGELSSVRSSVGTTNLMGGVIRAIEKQDPKLARELAEDGKAKMARSAVFHAMLRNASITNKGVELPVLNLGSAEAAERLQTPELLELVNNPNNAGKLLKLLAPLFKDCLLRVRSDRGDFTIYLPAVASQDANLDFIAQDSLSDLMQQIVVLYIQGIDVSAGDFLGVAGRAQAALYNLAMSEGNNKLFSGRKSVQAKVVCVPGVALDTLVIKQSAHPKSVFKTLERTFR